MQGTAPTVPLGTRSTRRHIATTGAKLAYAVPLVVASYKLTARAAAAKPAPKTKPKDEPKGKGKGKPADTALISFG